MKLQDAVVVVTGASMGIGEAIARELGSRGAKIVLAARSAERIQEIAGELPESIAIPTDMTKEEDIRVLLQGTKERYGRVDVLINNAGQGLMASVQDINVNDYRSLLELNVVAPLIAMQQVIPIMRQQGSGMILNISSMVSKNYYPGIGGYASTKYALNALSLTARKELESDGIVVSVFHPKMTATDFGHNARGTQYDSRAGRPGMDVDSVEDVARSVAQQLESEEPESMM